MGRAKRGGVKWGGYREKQGFLFQKVKREIDFGHFWNVQK